MIQLNVFGQTTFDSSKISNDILSLCQIISRDSILMGDKIGFGGDEPEQWRRYEKLKEITTDTVLFELTNYPDPVVRGYAFSGLIDKESGFLLKAIKKNEDDTVTLRHQWGCILSATPLIDFVAYNAYEYYNTKQDKDNNALKYLEALKKRVLDRFMRRMKNKK
jgi:hypothetical protein